MCFSNIGSLQCRACGGDMGEFVAGSESCPRVCGLFVSRPTGKTYRKGDCALCIDKKLDMARKVAELNAYFARSETASGTASGSEVRGMTVSWREQRLISERIEAGYMGFVPLMVRVSWHQFDGRKG